MEEHVEAFAKLLYRGNTDAFADLQSAIADWQTFYNEHGRQIGVDVPWLNKIWQQGAELWDVLIDVGILHHFVFEADHSEFYDEIVAGIRELRPAAAVTANWKQLAATDADVEIENFFRSVASISETDGEALVILDKASDSYPLAFLPVDNVNEAKRLAPQIGDGQVVLAKEL